MSLSKNEITIQNIISCKQEVLLSTEEVDIFLISLIKDGIKANRSINDIKNDILYKYNLLNEQYLKHNIVLSQYAKIHEQIIICKYLVKSFKQLIDEQVNGIKHFKNVHISYWYSNNYSKEAYLDFEKLFLSCTPEPLDSFTAVCESIDRHDKFGIIPVINSNDGRMMSFYRLLDQYDLKISVIKQIENYTENGFTKYALVGNRLLNIRNTDKITLEFSSSKPISEIINAINEIGGNLGEITSIPLQYGSNDFINYISLTVNKDILPIMWIFLYLFVDDIEFVGIYSEL